MAGPSSALAASLAPLRCILFNQQPDRPLFFFGAWRHIGPKGVLMGTDWVSFVNLDSWVDQHER